MLCKLSGCSGYTIPKGFKVFAAFRGVHLDQDLYKDARAFNPWRWQVCKITNLTLFTIHIQIVVTYVKTENRTTPERLYQQMHLPRSEEDLDYALGMSLPGYHSQFSFTGWSQISGKHNYDTMTRYR